MRFVSNHVITPLRAVLLPLNYYCKSYGWQAGQVSQSSGVLGPSDEEFHSPGNFDRSGPGGGDNGRPENCNRLRREG